MQSDQRVAASLTAVGPRIALFRLAVSTALERARGLLASESGPAQARAVLGEFGGRLMDADRFAMISSGAGPLDAMASAAVQRCAGALDVLLESGDDQFVIDVGPGASMAAAVRDRLAVLGSVFAAALIVEHVRRRSYDPTQHRFSGGHPFELWSAGDRKLAPPLVVRVDGADLEAAALAPFIDGCVRFILVVSGPATAAPLARLISPGVFVAQADDPAVIDRVKELEGPALIALMAGDEARFVHSPRAGSAAWQRMTITRVPAAEPRRALGLRTAWQQREDLAQLKSLIEQPALPAVPGSPVAVPVEVNGFDPAERLTAWLLDNSGLSAQVGAPQ